MRIKNILPIVQTLGKIYSIDLEPKRAHLEKELDRATKRPNAPAYMPGLFHYVNTSEGCEGMGELIILIAVVGVGIAFFAFASVMADSKKIAKNYKRLVGDFNVFQRYISVHGSAIAIDESDKQIAILQNLKRNGNVEAFPYKNILHTEVVIDSHTISQTSRSSQVAGIAAGGVLLGGVGALVGGLSANKISTNKIQSIVLRIIVDNPSSPVHEISFFSVPSGMSKNSEVVQKAMQDANHWHALLAFVIKQTDEEMNDEVAITAPEDKLFVADELLKLGELRERDLLSEEEFEKQKSKLLSN